MVRGVDWDQSRGTVRRPVPEYYVGSESRVVPLFPELRPHLKLCFDQARPGDDFVSQRDCRRDSNPRIVLTTITQQAGLKTWLNL